MNHDSLTAIELQMALRAVDNADTSYSDIGTAVKPQRLRIGVHNQLLKLFWYATATMFKCCSNNLLTVGLICGIFSSS